MEETEVLTTTVPPAEVSEGAFTFADDDLCEWVSEDEVAEFVAAEYEWDGTAVLDDVPPETEEIDCERRLTSTAGEVDDVTLDGVTAGNAGTWFSVGMVDVVDFDEELGVLPGSAVSGHPSLSDGVVAFSRPFGGGWAFWVPPSDEYLSLEMPWSFEEGALEEGDFEEAGDRFFGVADRFVQELGWLG